MCKQNLTNFQKTDFSSFGSNPNRWLPIPDLRLIPYFKHFLKTKFLPFGQKKNCPGQKKCQHFLPSTPVFLSEKTENSEIGFCTPKHDLKAFIFVLCARTHFLVIALLINDSKRVCIFRLRIIIMTPKVFLRAAGDFFSDLTVTNETSNILEAVYC